MALTLRQGADHLRLNLLPTRPDMEARVLAGAVALVNREVHAGVITSGAVLRATGLRGKGMRELAIVTELAPGAPDHNRYSVEIVDHVDGSDHSIIERGSPVFTYINVFAVSPGKRARMADHFARTVPHLRKQRGYVSTNVIVSADGRRVVNIGQYETRGDYLATFRRPEVIAGLAGIPGRLKVGTGGVSRPPRIRLCELAHEVAA
jgi:quinol monooxygenase YgiN